MAKTVARCCVPIGSSSHGRVGTTQKDWLNRRKKMQTTGEKGDWSLGCYIHFNRFGPIYAPCMDGHMHQQTACPSCVNCWIEVLVGEQSGNSIFPSVSSFHWDWPERTVQYSFSYSYIPQLNSLLLFFLACNCNCNARDFSKHPGHDGPLTYETKRLLDGFHQIMIRRLTYFVRWRGAGNSISFGGNQSRVSMVIQEGNGYNECMGAA